MSYGVGDFVCDMCDKHFENQVRYFCPDHEIDLCCTCALSSWTLEPTAKSTDETKRQTRNQRSSPTLRVNSTTRPRKYLAADDETPAMIALKFGIEVRDLVRMNKPYYPSISKHCKLYKDTAILLVDDGLGFGSSGEEGTDDEVEEEDYLACGICAQSGKLLTCSSDGCAVAVHPRCLIPACRIGTVNTSEWKCERCLAGLHPSSSKCVACDRQSSDLPMRCEHGEWYHYACVGKSKKKKKKTRKCKGVRRGRKHTSSNRKRKLVPDDEGDDASKISKDTRNDDDAQARTMREPTTSPRKPTKASKRRHVNVDMGVSQRETRSEPVSNIQKDVRNEIWEIVVRVSLSLSVHTTMEHSQRRMFTHTHAQMGSQMDGNCPVCRTGFVMRKDGGYHCSHIDSTRKNIAYVYRTRLDTPHPQCGHTCSPHRATYFAERVSRLHQRDEVWNIVPSCACNILYGQRCLFDFMAESSVRRQYIKQLAFIKVHTHLVGGYVSDTAPKYSDLLKYKTSSGTLDFASFVRDCFHAKDVDSPSNSYRELLTLDSWEEKKLLGKKPIAWNTYYDRW